MRTLASFILISLTILLTACTSGLLMVKEGDLHPLKLRMQEQEERLDRLESLSVELAKFQNSLLESQQEMSRRLRSVAEAQGEQLQRQEKWEKYIRSTRAQREKAETDDQRYPFVPEPIDKQLVGSVEKVFLSPPGTLLSARIDTGATTSSLDARNLERFERNGERWVRFVVVNPEDDSEHVLECKVVRNVLIIQSVTDEAERRPVVELMVTVGKIRQMAQFTISDRRHLEYPVLIGRNILMDVMMVDVSRTHIAPPSLTP